MNGPFSPFPVVITDSLLKAFFFNCACCYIIVYSRLGSSQYLLIQFLIRKENVIEKKKKISKNKKKERCKTQNFEISNDHKHIYTWTLRKGYLHSFLPLCYRWFFWSTAFDILFICRRCICLLRSYFWYSFSQSSSTLIDVHMSIDKCFRGMDWCVVDLWFHSTNPIAIRAWVFQVSSLKPNNPLPQKKKKLQKL